MSCGRKGTAVSREKARKSPGRRILGFIWKTLVVILALAAVLVGVLTVAEYRPAAVETVAPAGEAAGALRAGEPVSLVSWNIGYGALGDNADFFMDGGSSVHTADKARVEENLKGISDFLAERNPDIILLQETDANSARSHGTDERAVIGGALPGRTSAFAYNYSALFVPYPMPPIGHVESGLLTLSRYPVREAERVSLPCPFSWPIRTVNLKRCLLVTRIPVEGSEHELVLVNLHLEAYDDGTGKIEQTKQLAELLKEEAAAGNWVIAGGDFNQIFSNVENPWPVPEGSTLWKPGAIDAAAFDGLILLMDGAVPTCRSLDRAYDPKDESFQYYLIDGFIVSGGVDIGRLETVDKGFVHSDHNPVCLTVTLREQ